MRGPWLGQVKLAHSEYRPLPFISGRRLGDAPTINDSTFAAQVLSQPKAIVDFWSPDCPYCVDFKPIFEAMAANPPSGVKMFTAKVDEAGQTLAGFNPKYLPTVIFFQNGKEVHRAEGGMSASDFAAEVSQAFGGSVPAPAVPAGAPSKPGAGPTSVTTGVSSGSSPWLAIGGVAAAGLMGWLILRQ